jgi:hypothetical protein
MHTTFFCQKSSVVFWDIMHPRVAFLTDVLGQPMDPIFKGQEIQEEIFDKQ